MATALLLDSVLVAVPTIYLQRSHATTVAVAVVVAVVAVVVVIVIAIARDE